MNETGERCRQLRWLAAVVLLMPVLAAPGCQDPRGPVAINSDDPDLKILAMKQDAAERHTKDIPAMVEDLQSDDPAIRFYAIQALHRLTHDDLGYHYYETDDQRAPALSRWRAWLKQRG